MSWGRLRSGQPDGLVTGTGAPPTVEPLGVALGVSDAPPGVAPTLGLLLGVGELPPSGLGPGLVVGGWVAWGVAVGVGVGVACSVGAFVWCTVGAGDGCTRMYVLAGAGWGRTTK
jgi:hypothetical protein